MAEEGGGGEGFEEWDADFLNQLIHVEERALSSSSSSSSTFFQPTFTQPLSYLPPLPSPFLEPQPQRHHHRNLPPPSPLSYSPPRELSQRPPPQSDAHGELGWTPPPLHAPTKAPRILQKERSEIRSKRGRKRENQHNHQQLVEPVCPPDPDRGKVTIECPKGNKNVRERDVEVPSSVSVGVITAEAIDYQISCRADMATCRAVGVQTDEAPESTGLRLKNECHAHQKLSNNLRSIWCCPKAQQLPSTFLSKMFVACRSLFCTMNADRSSKSGTDCLSDKISANASEVALVSKFYSAFIEKVTRVSVALTRFILLLYYFDTRPKTLGGRLGNRSVASSFGLWNTFLHKVAWLTSPELDTIQLILVTPSASSLYNVSNGMARLETLFQPLFYLCSVDNVSILSGSLNIMYLILDHILATERVSRERNNVVWKGPLSMNDTGADPHGNKACGFDLSFSCGEAAPTVFPSVDLMLTNLKSQLRMGDSKCSTSVDSSNFISIFGLMHELVKRNTEECVRLRAVSIMKALLLNGGAYGDRAKFPLPQAFESVLILLKKGSGKKLQEQALHLLFLLLNCPKIFEAFVVSCEDMANSVECEDSGRIFPGIDDILQSLADCLSYGGSSVQDLILRRKVVVLVAFIASSGLKGFEIVINSMLSDERNILSVMLQALISDLDIEGGGGSTESPEIWRERNLLLREALILLNRLMSNPSSSAACLRLLTNTRDVASLTISFASRVCKRQPRCIQPSDRLIGVHDLDDLARAFKRRVFAYLGDHVT